MGAGSGMSPADVHQTGFVVLLQSRFLWEMGGGNNSMTVCSTSWAGGQDVQQNVQDTHACISMWKKTHVYKVCVYNAHLKE